MYYINIIKGKQKGNRGDLREMFVLFDQHLQTSVWTEVTGARCISAVVTSYCYFSLFLFFLFFFFLFSKHIFWFLFSNLFSEFQYFDFHIGKQVG